MDLFEDDCHDCDCQLSQLHYTVMMSGQQQIQREQDAKLVQSMYKQLALQKMLSKDYRNTLDPTIKKEIEYTNKELVNQMGQTIINKNINFPSSYMNLTQDQNTNTILNAIQNRQQHLQLNPLG